MSLKKKESLQDTKNENVLDILKTAKCQFLLRNFSDCVASCINGFEAVGKVHFPSEVINSDSKWNQTYVSLAIIAVQALAEQDKWSEVLEFLKKWFGEFWQFPSQIVVLCISLYVKLGQLATLEYLVNEWITREENVQDELYFQITDLYVYRILYPLGGKRKVVDVLDCLPAGCCIPEERIQVYIEYNESITEQRERKNSIHPASSSVNESTKSDQKIDTSSLVKIQNKGSTLQRLLRTLQWMRSIFQHYMAQRTFKQLGRFLLLMFFLYAVLFTTHSPGLLSRGSGAAVLWQGVVQTWKALFAPYHLMPRDS